MGPEIEQFLSGMRKTMEQVVLPNLSDPFAQEQAGIVMATLGFLEQVHDKAFHYELLENDRYRCLLGRLLELLQRPAASAAGEVPDPEVGATLAAVRDHLDAQVLNGEMHRRPYDVLRAANETMKEQLSELVRLLPSLSPESRAAFDELLTPFSRELVTRERAWVKPLAFDARSAEVPDLAELLYRDGVLDLRESTVADLVGRAE